MLPNIRLNRITFQIVSHFTLEIILVRRMDDCNTLYKSAWMKFEVHYSNNFIGTKQTSNNFVMHRETCTLQDWHCSTFWYWFWKVHTVHVILTAFCQCTKWLTMDDVMLSFLITKRAALCKGGNFASQMVWSQMIDNAYSLLLQSESCGSESVGNFKWNVCWEGSKLHYICLHTTNLNSIFYCFIGG